MFRAQGSANETPPVVDMDFCQIAGIVYGLHLFADEGGQRRFDITSTHEPNAITQNFAGLRHVDKQHVELLQTVGHIQ